MNSVFTLLALASTIFAQGYAPRGDTDTMKTKTMTTYETVTTCPVTSTKTLHGTTSVVTELTTSTVTVTSCIGGCEPVVTVPGPTGKDYTTTEVLVTYTTECPTTVTKTAPGTTYTEVFTTISTVITLIPTTVEVYTTLPDTTTSVEKEITTTITSPCPYTETQTLPGGVVTLTYTSYTTYVTVVPTKIVETVIGPPSTTSVLEGVTSVITSLCPTTETKTIGGELVTLTYTSTSLIYTVIPTKILETVTGPPLTTSVVEGVTSVITSLCPTTETKTIGGELVTLTYTSTSLIYTVIPTKVISYETLAPHTTIIETFVYQTSVSLCPITEISTISGHEVTVVITSTSLVVQKIPTTIIQTTTALTTYYLTSEIYETETEYTTDYTTVSAGSTIVVATTEKHTFLVTSAYTVTKTLEAPTTKATVFEPITIESSLGVTEVVTIPSEITVTSPGGTVINTVPFTAQTTSVAPPSTVVAPPSTAATSVPLQVSPGAAPTNRPIAYAAAGVMALFALA